MDYCLIAAASFSWGSWSSWWAIMQMALGLGAVIFVHELGHFLVAKACGVKCEKFYLGFDAFDIKIGRHVIVPRSLLKWTWGETQYGVGILPLGGYVKMLGQDDNPSNIANERQRSVEATHEVSAAGLDLEETAVGPIDRSKLDPRSYQAKTVPQRMAIISAGVIMNLIFSVIFATIAFQIGVTYEPVVIGQTVPGSPAYIADLDGAEVLKVNGRSTRDAYYTFQHFIEEVVLNGPDRPIDLELEYRHPESESKRTVTRQVTPALNISPDFPDIASIGASAAATNKLGELATLPEQAAARAEPPFQMGDSIVEVDGATIEDLNDLRRAFATAPEREVHVVVERSRTKNSKTPFDRVAITIPPNPTVEFGLSVAMGPIRAIRSGSPAAGTELKVGDVIETIDGSPVGDPTELDMKLLQPALARTPVHLGIRRYTTETEPERFDVHITPCIPARHGIHGNNLTAIDSLGVAVFVSNQVTEVESGGPAETAGIQTGDQVLGAEFLLSDELKENPMYRGSGKVVFADGFVGWINVFEQAQLVRPPQPIRIDLLRDGKKTSVTLTPRVSTDRFSANRGIRPVPLERAYRANSWWEAIQLGADRTYRDMGRVWQMLKKLVRGQVAIKHLGGPGTIAVVATSEASQGLSRLLLFLTLLGANLAILNFLPIPILDGGHMMFLAYEGIFRRPVNERVQIILSFMGLFFIIGLMLLVISLDIFRFLF